MKVCLKCKQSKPESEYGHSARGRGGLYPQCKTCHAAYLAEWRAGRKPELQAQSRKYKEGNPQQFRTYWLRNKYGITAEDYFALLMQQEGVCAICRQPETMTLRGRLRNLAVDHDHKTGKVRGLLCSRCNTIIGQVAEEPGLLAALVAYLAAWQA